MTTLQVVSAALGELKAPRLRAGLVTPLFQPIVVVRAGGRRVIVAVEALSRGPQGTAFESPVALFAAVRRSGLVAQLDRLCIETALDAARRLPAHLVVFLNVHPATLCLDSGFADFLAEAAERHGIAPSRLALEILEHSRVTDCQCRQLLSALQVVRGTGVRLAVDDVSGAHEDFRRALALRPEFLKVDAEVVRGARTDLASRALLRAIAAQAAGIGARVVAEGIEDQADLDVAATAGIELAQGHLLGRPVVADIVNRLAAR